MTDDIVTRLREKYAGQLPICTEAADEIERLRELVRFKSNQLDAIREAVHNEGINPKYHRKVMNKHRKEWPILWKAIDESMKELAQKLSRMY